MNGNFRKLIAAAMVICMAGCLFSGCSNDKTVNTESGDSKAVSESAEEGSETIPSDDSNELSKVASAASNSDTSKDSSSVSGSTSTENSSEESKNESVSPDIKSELVGKWTYKSESGYMNMALNEDGTVTAESSDLASHMRGTWTAEGSKVTVTIYGGDSVYTYEDGKLVSVSNPSTVFVKGKTDAEESGNVQEKSDSSEVYAGITEASARKTAQEKMGDEYTVVSVSKGVDSEGKDAWVIALMKSDGSSQNLFLYYVSENKSEKGDVIVRDGEESMTEDEETEEEAVEDLLTFIGHAEGYTATVVEKITVEEEGFVSEMEYYKLDLQYNNGSETQHVDYFYTPVKKYYRVILDSQTFNDKFIYG